MARGRIGIENQVIRPRRSIGRTPESLKKQDV
jgi:hypothetical protein